jgi:hypothetical protein
VWCVVSVVTGIVLCIPGMLLLILTLFLESIGPWH